MWRLVIVGVLLLAVCWESKGQDILTFEVSEEFLGEPLTAVFDELESHHGARFFYLPEWVKSYDVSEQFIGGSIDEVLTQIFAGTDLTYLQMYPQVIVIVKDPELAIQRREALRQAAEDGLEVDQLQIGQEEATVENGPYQLRGRVVDEGTGEGVPFASVRIDGSEVGTNTDEGGLFQIQLTAGAHLLEVRFVEYDTKVISLDIYEDGEIDVVLQKKSILLQEVLIVDETSKEVATRRIGQTPVPVVEMRRAPPFLGEVDVVKQVQRLPGVTTVGEVAAGFNVRGGSVDQNLILYDGVPTFNSAHAFGFLSAFNSDALRDVSLMKGGIPAIYGGRTSSVLDIHSRDGDYEKWQAKVGIGLITANATAHGPLKKDKSSLLASFRTTYSDWLVRSVRTNYADLRESSVSFFDGTLKFSQLLNNNSKLSVTGYASQDEFQLIGDSTYRWDNYIISGRFDHEWTPEWSGEFQLGASSFGYQVVNDDSLTAADLSFRITSLMAKANIRYERAFHRMSMGWELTHYRFNPGTLEPTSAESVARSVQMDKQYSIESAWYFSDEWNPLDRLTIEAGLRLPLFMSLGPATVNLYESGQPIEVGSMVDSVEYGNFEIIKTYFGLEPRLSARWMLDISSSLKLGYNRINQFLHLVTNTTAVTPVDIWQPSGFYFEPQRSDQISFGYFKDFAERKYNLSTEVFHKWYSNIVDFKDAAQLLLNDHLETELLQGKGQSYGFEFSFQKNTGKLTGSVNYTFSRAFREFTGSSIAETINDGERYPASFDMPHSLNLSWRVELSKRHFFTGQFTYHTGRPVTVPVSAITLENSTVAYFSERNQFRIPDYHRLDVALVVEGNHKRDKRWEGTWVFSVYNAYARNNPYSVFFRSDGQGIPQPYQLSIIGTIFPSVSYNIRIL